MATRADGFSDEERAAMKARKQELADDARRDRKRADGIAEVAAAIAAMPDEDRALAARIDAIIMKAVPELGPRTWYGMPAYALDGKVVCFLQVGSKFGTRYATLGFNDTAKLDDGPMWPTSFAVTRLNRPAEARIRALVTSAVHGA